MGRFCASHLFAVFILIGSKSLLCEGYETQTPSSNAVVPPVVQVAPSTPATLVATPPMEVAIAPSPKPLTPTQIPCTCGIFLGSQFKKGSTEQPTGSPVFRHEHDRAFPCTPLGARQCQNKCLEVFVRHLPNAGPLLCATLDRDCHKEKAFLFVQNCEPKWLNSNLSTGKEYCCRGGAPYQCPLI